MLGIEIPLTENLTFLKPYNQYVWRESLKQKMTIKERESVLERVEMSIPIFGYRHLIFWCLQFIDTVIYESLPTEQMNTGILSRFLPRHWHRSLALTVILVPALCKVASPPKLNLQKYFFCPHSICIFLKPGNIRILTFSACARHWDSTYWKTWHS